MKRGILFLELELELMLVEGTGDGVGSGTGDGTGDSTMLAQLSTLIRRPESSDQQLCMQQT